MNHSHYELKRYIKAHYQDNAKRLTSNSVDAFESHSDRYLVSKSGVLP